MKHPDYATIATLKDILGLSESTQWRMRKDGRLAFFKIGRSVRYKLSEILEQLEAR